MLPDTTAIGFLSVGLTEARQLRRVAGAAVVIAMPENCPVAADVLFNRGSVAALRPSAILVGMSSVKPAKALGHTLAAGRRGIAYTPCTQATADLSRGPLSHFGDLDHCGLFTELERRNPPPRSS